MRRNTMNVLHKITLSLLLYIILGNATFAQVVEIPDANLRRAVKEALNLPAGTPITQAAMRDLTSLNVGDLGIADLSGLEFATGLTGLAIFGNQITDLTPITGLTKLEHLLMWVNPISDITPLANLTNLLGLDAGGCHITDITPLANLTQLTGLNLRHNSIVNIDSLANLSLLTELRLNSNAIADVTPLSNLTKLKLLEIQHNNIGDHSPLDVLSLTHFKYDQSCEMPPLPLKPRLENRTFPSVFSAWGGLGWSSVLNQPHLSDLEQMSQHDLYFCCLMFNQRFFDTGDGWEVRGDLERAIQIRDDYIALNPNMIFLVEIRMRDASLDLFPEHSPYWVRDGSGNLLGDEWHLIDFTHPDVQDMIVGQAIALSKCGLYDGIFLDWWNEDGVVLGNWATYDAEQRARDSILERIRAATRPDFLIMVNTNRRIIPRTGKHINGGFMETGTPSNDSHVGGIEEIERGLQKIESTLQWAEQNMREPRINALEGWGFPTEPLDSPTNLRWMRAFTTLSLTHSDGYVLYNDGIYHSHYWYDFWDADLGRPVGSKFQLYDEEIPGLYIREFTNGWAVYNHSGEAQVITLPEKAQGVASGLANTEHALQNFDGEMYLRKTVDSDQSPVTSKNPADVNDDGVVNILDLTIVAQGFGTDSLEADVNGDGLVNILDLVFVANQF